MADDPYAALGLDKSASQDEIRKAYRRIARTSHPDLNPDDPGAEARFKAASAAHDLLKDPERRARFDRGEIDATGAEQQTRRQYYRDYAEAGSNPYGPRGQYEDFGDAADIFAEMFRQQRRGPGSGADRDFGFSAPGPDHRYALEVPFLDAARGGTARVTLPDGGTLDVKIPPGTREGQTLRLRGKGGPGFGEGKPGDALVTISIAAHPVFRREGNDILATLPVSLSEAVLGARVEVPTIDGPVNLTIPKGASSGQTLRLRGRGVAPASGPAGDQRVELRIVLPREIDDDLAAFMRDWAEKHPYDPRKGRST